MPKIMDWYGTDGNDYFFMFNSPYTRDHVWAGNGNDIIEDGPSWNDWTSDIFRGEAGNDVLYSFSGNDRLYGGVGNDVLKVHVGYHDSYNNPVDKEDFNVKVHGGDGYDVLYMVNAGGSTVTHNEDGSYDIETRYHGHVKATGIEEVVFVHGNDFLL